jgi:hypothetical protein
MKTMCNPSPWSLRSILELEGRHEEGFRSGVSAWLIASKKGEGLRRANMPVTRELCCVEGWEGGPGRNQPFI